VGPGRRHHTDEYRTRDQRRRNRELACERLRPLAGRFADGWHALPFTLNGIADRLGDFERGGDLGDRDRASQRVTLSIPCCALEDGDRARELTRQHLAFYIGGMGTYYRDALARQGYEETATTVFEAWNGGEREAAIGAVDDDLLDELALAGTPEHCRAHLERFEATIDVLAP